MNNEIVAAAYLELILEIKHQFISLPEEIKQQIVEAAAGWRMASLIYSIDSDDASEIVAALRRRKIRVATTDGALESAVAADPPPVPVTSAGKAGLRSCDPAEFSVKVPCD